MDVRNVFRKLAAIGALGGAVPAFAVGTDFSTLTASVDFTTVGVALLAIGAAVMAPKVVMWGVSAVTGMIGKR